MKSRTGQDRGALVFAAGIPLAAPAAGKPPARMKVLNWGDNPNPRGKRVHVGPRLAASFESPVYPYRKAPLDFEHNTVPGTPAYAESSEPRPVAAYCAVEVVPGDGVFFKPFRWTSDGEKNYEHYCDLSAAPVTDAAGEVVAVVSAAICRVGQVPDMELPVPLSAAGLLDGNDETGNKEGNVDWKATICKALGLDPAAVTDEDAAKALAKALAAGKPPAADGQAQALSAAAISAAVEAAVKPLTEKMTALSASADGWKAELLKRDKQGALERARLEGKVIALSATAVEAMSLADLEDHIKKTPATVPLSALTPPHVAEPAAGAGPTEQQRAIALSCGADPDKVWPKQQ